MRDKKNRLTESPAISPKSPNLKPPPKAIPNHETAQRPSTKLLKAAENMPAPKSPSRIDIWRHEVSSSVSASESEYSSHHSVQHVGFWKKFIKPKFNVGGEGKCVGKDEAVKTVMYEGEKEEKGSGEKGKGDGDGDVGSSMDLGSGESELGGFRERRERLERAARLLSGSRKKKV